MSRTITLYHVTFQKKLYSILHKPGLGIISNQKRTWHNPFGAPLGKRDHIYAFTDRMEAVLWAGKQMFEFDEPCSIIEFEDQATAWQKEESSAHYQEGYYSWQHHIGIEQFRAITTVLTRDVREAMKERTRRAEEAQFNAKEAPTS